MPQATATLMISRLPNPLHRLTPSLPLWLMWSLPGRLQAQASTSLMQVSGCAQEQSHMGGCAEAAQCPVVACAQVVPVLRHRSVPSAPACAVHSKMHVSAGATCYWRLPVSLGVL